MFPRLVSAPQREALLNALPFNSDDLPAPTPEQAAGPQDGASPGFASRTATRSK